MNTYSLTHRANAVASVYAGRDPWTPVYGLARTLIGMGTFLTLLCNDSQVVFRNLAEVATHEDGLFTHRINLFYLMSPHLEMARYISLVVLFAVVIGWRPKLTGLLHWWITFSFVNSSPVIDGGDQIASILSFFLIPLCITDNRTWHWQAPRQEPRNPLLVLLLWSFVFIIRLQVCFIYFHSGVDKLKVEEWTDGTCTYYWFTNNIYGVNNFLKGATYFLMSKPLVVVLLSWGTLVLEIVLGMSFFMRRNALNWKVLFLIAFVFHVGIMIVFGLVTFFLVMAAALVLYLVPFDYRWNQQQADRLYIYSTDYLPG